MLSDAERIGFYEAGASASPREPGTVPSAEQLWFELLQAAPDKRLAYLRHLLSQADVAHACFAEDHRGRLEDAKDRETQLLATLKRAGVRW